MWQDWKANFEMWERHLADVLANLKMNMKLVMTVLKPCCHLKFSKCLTEPGDMGQELAWEHPCSCWGQSPVSPLTSEPGLQRTSGKPRRNKPGGERSFCLSYSYENAEQEYCTLWTSWENCLSSLSLENICTHAHTCRHACIHTHCSLRLLLLHGKQECGVVYGERQERPEEKDKFPCTAFSVAREQMCSVCCLILC